MGRPRGDSVMVLGFSLILGGCQAPGLPSAGEMSPAGQPAPSVVHSKHPSGGPCVSGSVPDWVTQGDRIQHPNGAHLEGRGDSTESQQDADAEARVELVKYLENRITGSLDIVERESSGAGHSYTVTSQKGEQVSLRLSGLQIHQRWSDQACHRFSSLARLDLKKAVDAWLLDLRHLDGEGKAFRRQADEWLGRGEVFGAIRQLERLREVQDVALPITQRMTYVSQSFLSPQDRQPAPALGLTAETEGRIETIIQAVQLRKATGDGQRARDDGTIDDPLAVRLVVVLSDGEVPVPNVPIQYRYEAGQGEVDPVVRTDRQGLASAAVRRVQASDQSVSIAASVSIDSMSEQIPGSLQGQVGQHIGAQVIRFNLVPPQALSLLDQQLSELAYRLARNSNQSQGKPIVIKEFYENRSKRRLSLSDVIEPRFARALAKAQVLRIVEPRSGTALEKDSRPNTRVTEGPVAEVRGEYQLESNGTVYLGVTLLRLSDRQRESGSEVYIPRTAFTPDDLRELDSGLPTQGPAPILKEPAPSQTEVEWGKELWAVHNPSGFKTDLEPERPMYPVGETASFRFRTERDCYLTVFNIGTSGRVTVLVPNAHRASPPQRLVSQRGGWVRIPTREEEDRGLLRFPVSPPLGEERLKAFCTVSPLELVKGSFERGFLPLFGNSGTGYRNWGVAVEAPEPEEWSEAHTTVVTLEPHQVRTRGMEALQSRGLLRPE